MRSRYLFLLFLSLLTTLGYAQKPSKKEKRLDSLQKVLVTIDKTKPQYIEVLGKICFEYRRSNPQKIAELAQEMLTLSKVQNYERGLAEGYYFLGMSFQLQDTYVEALKNYLEALKIFEKLANKTGKARTYNGIGIVYSNQKEYEKAKYYYNLYISLSDDNDTKATALNNIGNIYKDTKNYDSAVVLYRQAFSLTDTLKDRTTYALLLSNMGDVLVKTEHYDSAYWYCNKARRVLIENANTRTLTTALNNLGLIFLRKQTYDSAEILLQEGLTKSLKIKRKENIRNAYLYLSELYEKQKKYDLALDCYRQMTVYQDSIFSEEKSRGLASLQITYDLDKKETELQFLQKAAEKDKVIFYSQLLLTLLMIIAAFVFYKISNKAKKAEKVALQANEELQQTLDVVAAQKQEIEHQNHDITASINYARRIQRAMLPSESVFEKAFGKNNFFILFQPRDIVSGDFYWLATKEIIDEQQQAHPIQVLAVADCTGHGVPGALMSMIGDSLLNQIIHDKEIHYPSMVLKLLNDGIKAVLKQEETAQNDGMDIIILTIIPHEKIVQYAGAVNSLYYVQSGLLHEIKGSKYSLGGFQQTQLFEEHSITIEQPTTFYLRTDGYEDQFGGKEKRKLMAKQLKQLLWSIADQPMDEQKRFLETHFQAWRDVGNEKQIDDVTLIGFRCY